MGEEIAKLPCRNILVAPEIVSSGGGIASREIGNIMHFTADNLHETHSIFDCGGHLIVSVAAGTKQISGGRKAVEVARWGFGSGVAKAIAMIIVRGKAGGCFGFGHLKK